MWAPGSGHADPEVPDHVDIAAAREVGTNSLAHTVRLRRPEIFFVVVQRDSNPVPFDRLKSAVSLGAPLEPRARKHRTRSRAPVSLTVVDVQWGIALPAPVQGTTRH